MENDREMFKTSYIIDSRRITPEEFLRLEYEAGLRSNKRKERLFKRLKDKKLKLYGFISLN